MKTKRNMHRKIFFFMLFVTLLLLAALSVGTTLGKFSLEGLDKTDFTLTLDKTIITRPAELGGGKGDPVSPDRPGIEEETPTTVYQVQAGETLASVAEKFHITVEALAACNGLSPDAELTPGTILKLPAQN